MRVRILGSRNRPGVQDAIERLLPEISACVTSVAVDWIEDGTSPEGFSSASNDLVMVFGGDGSILRAIQQMGVQQLPIMAVNLGRLGFLANVSLDEAVELLERLRRQTARLGKNWPEKLLEKENRGKSRRQKPQVTISEHLLLDCQVTHRTAGRRVETHSALVVNEVAIQNASFRIMEVRLFADDEFVTTYSCDGLILSTPVGSTAHSLSAGGPILRQDLDDVVISPIAPHTLTYRPVVDSARRVYRLEATCKDDAPGVVVVDGSVLCQLRAGDSVQVTASDTRFRMLNPPGYSYYTNLQRKLGWSGHAYFNGEER